MTTIEKVSAVNVQPYSGSENEVCSESLQLELFTKPFLHHISMETGHQMSYEGLVAHLWNIAKDNLPLIIH